jgi:hypothetical protein
MASEPPQTKEKRKEASRVFDPNVITEVPETPKVKGPHDLNEINPKLSSDIHFWAHEFHVTGQQLHEAIRVHGTHVSKIREALKHHK